MAAYQTVKDLTAAAVEKKGFRPGMVSMVQTTLVYVPAGDRQGKGALVRHMIRSPVSLSRLRFTPGSPEVVYLNDERRRLRPSDRPGWGGCRKPR